VWQKSLTPCRWARARKAADTESQLRFAFAPSPGHDAARNQILEALEFAAESGKEAPTLQPPRPGGDDSEVLVVQTPGAQIGQRGDQLIVSVKGEDVRKIPGQQVRAIYCYGAIQLTAQAVETCLELGIDVSYFSPARLQYSVFECPLDDMRLAKLKAELHESVNHDEDQVLFLSLGPSANDASLIIEAMGLPYEVRSRVTII